MTKKIFNASLLAVGVVLLFSFAVIAACLYGYREHAQEAQLRDGLDLAAAAIEDSGLSCLEKIDNNVISASHSLGANRFQTFISVVLPQSFSGLMTGILIVLIPVAGSFVEPNIAGGPYSMMIGSRIDSQFTTSMNMGYGAALSLLFLVVMSLTLAVIRLVMNIADKRIGG